MGDANCPHHESCFSGRVYYGGGQFALAPITVYYLTQKFDCKNLTAPQFCAPLPFWTKAGSSCTLGGKGKSRCFRHRDPTNASSVQLARLVKTMLGVRKAVGNNFEEDSSKVSFQVLTR